MHGGWGGLPPVELDGENWPLDFAARILGVPERDLRDLVRITGLEPAGTLQMAEFRRSGRAKRVYNGAVLVRLHLAAQRLAAEMSGTPAAG
jgi:hypothetical protein